VKVSSKNSDARGVKCEGGRCYHLKAGGEGGQGVGVGGRLRHSQGGVVEGLGGGAGQLQALGARVGLGAAAIEANSYKYCYAQCTKLLKFTTKSLKTTLRINIFHVDNGIVQVLAFNF
jgi:hypothetical protein